MNQSEITTNIFLPDAFQSVINSNSSYYLIYGGRLGGKTKGTSIISIATMLANPYNDIIVARVSYGSLSDSSYSEFQNTIDNDFAYYKDQFIFKRSPLRIERINNGGTIYFLGYGGYNTSRTKSFKTKHPIKIVILEETQELKDKRNLDEALASFRRQFGDGVKVLILGNPQPQASHWFTKFINEKKFDNDWVVKNITYLDILPFINDYDLKEIIKTKLTDPDFYKWFYMGESCGSWGSVYPMFRKERHEISEKQYLKVLESSAIRPIACIIGGDGAVNNDCTSFVPQILLNNGQVVIGPIFYHNPKEDGVIGYHQLVQNLLRRWVEDTCKRFALISPEEYRARKPDHFPPIWMRIDCAAPDLIAECKFFFGDRIRIAPIRKGHIVEMVGVVQSAIGNNNVVIIDYGGHYNYTKNMWVKDNENLLTNQIQSLIWNEQETGYDPIVPNDVCDAFTYGTYFWYSNIENIEYFNIIKTKGLKNLFISDIIKNIQRKEN